MHYKKTTIQGGNICMRNVATCFGYWLWLLSSLFRASLLECYKATSTLKVTVLHLSCEFVICIQNLKLVNLLLLSLIMSYLYFHL